MQRRHYIVLAEIMALMAYEDRIGQVNLMRFADLIGENYSNFNKTLFLDYIDSKLKDYGVDVAY